MKRIFKYELKTKDEQILELPIRSKILSLVTLNNKVYVCAIVDTEQKENESYLIAIHNIGHFVGETDDYTFLGTVVLFNGRLIWHIFCKRLT
jgi:hypothetical protein